MGNGNGNPPGRLRCAIYTRKSTEEGLEQEFNTLDAQREAGEAFIQSQRREGWRTLPERQNAMKHSDRQNARFEHDRALQRVVTDLLADHTELFKQFSDNPSFRKWLADTIFSATYGPGAAAPPPAV